jgi:hypothetical protein
MRLVSTMRAPVALLVGAAVAAAASSLTLQADAIQDAYNNRLPSSLAFLIASILLQLLGLKLPGRGTLSVSAVGLVGAAIALGTGPAMAIAVVTALAQWMRSRGLAHRALFDAANLALSAGAAGVAFERITSLETSGIVHLLAALLAGLAYVAVNLGLLCLAMALSEARSPLSVWHERFHFARFHVLAYGALGLLAATAADRLGAAALAAFLLPPILLALSMRDGLTRFRPAL